MATKFSSVIAGQFLKEQWFSSFLPTNIFRKIALKYKRYSYNPK